MGMRLDSVIFPGMVPLKGNMSRKRPKTAIFSYKAFSRL